MHVSRYSLSGVLVTLFLNCTLALAASPLPPDPSQWVCADPEPTQQEIEQWCADNKGKGQPAKLGVPGTLLETPSSDTSPRPSLNINTDASSVPTKTSSSVHSTQDNGCPDDAISRHSPDGIRSTSACWSTTPRIRPDRERVIAPTDLPAKSLLAESVSSMRPSLQVAIRRLFIEWQKWLDNGRPIPAKTIASDRPDQRSRQSFDICGG
jgi:hypothetical protein